MDEDIKLPDFSDDEDAMVGKVSFDDLSSTDFEEFCFDLISDAGFINVDWRKGTPKDASPADRGRDIVAQFEREDVDGHKYSETWFVDCKHYKTAGVPPDALHGTLAWAQAERPSTVLFIASGYLSNGAKDWIDSVVRNTNPPFRLRVWELPQLRKLIAEHRDVAFKHEVAVSEFRRISQILAVESELFDKLWYGRSPGRNQPDPTDWAPGLVQTMRNAQLAMHEKYGIEELESHFASQFAWGMLSGKVSAIRWVLGDEWDMLDS